MRIPSLCPAAQMRNLSRHPADTVDLSKVTFASDDLRRAYAYASTYGETDTARQFLAGYEMSRETVENYRRGFDAAYSEGYTGRAATGGAATWAGGLNPTIRTLAQQAGRAAQERQAGRLMFSEEVDTAVRRAVEAMPQEYTEGYTGVVNRTTGKLSAFQSVQMAVADQLGKKFGMVYTFVDSGTDIAAQEGVQGAYRAGTNHAVIALDAQEGMLLSVAGHETLHYVKEWTGKNEAGRAAYEEFQDFMLEKLRATEGYDLEERIKQKQEAYSRAGMTIDRAGAIEEIVADSMGAVFSREENVQDFLQSQKKSLVDRVTNAVKRMVKAVKKAIRSIAQNNPEIEAMLKQDADTLQEIADRFDRLGAMARAVRESEAGVAETKFSLKDAEPDYANLPDSAFYEDGRIYDYDFLTAQKDAKVVTVPSLDELMQNGRINRADVVEAGKRNAGGAKTARGYAQVTNTYTGRTLNVSNESIKHGMHGQKKRILTNAQLGAVVGDIVKEGIPINGLKTEDRNALGTYAMVTMCETSDGKPIMAVTHVDMQRGEVQDISFVDMVHSVNGRLYKKSEPGSSPIDASAGKPSHPSRFTISISDLLLEVNSSFQSILSEDVLNRLNETRSPEGAYTDKVKFSVRDDAYMAAAKSGDTQTAQRMLDEEAEEKFAKSKVRDKKGRLLKVYHGTKAQFTVFDTSKQGGVNGTAEGYGIYLSDSQEVTRNYGERQIAAYVNITNPATRWKKTISQTKLARLIKDTCMRQARRMVDDGEYDTVREAVRDSWVSNYTDTYSTTMDAAYRDTAASIIEMNDSDMDIIQEVMVGMAIRSYADAETFYNEVLTPVMGIDGFWTTWKSMETGERQNIILAFNSEQIKSAEPVTYDDAGEIIPLGGRFSKENPDIRYSLRDSEGRELSEQQQKYFAGSKVRDNSGQLMVMYHGTTAYGEITKFRKGKRGWLGPGIYLTNRKSYAQRYADAMGEGNGSMYELYANVENPLVVTESSPVREILMAAYGRDLYARRAATQSIDAAILTAADIRKLMGKGYDGIVWKYGGSMEVSVFSSEQIKRVDNRNPSDSQDIRYSLKDVDARNDEMTRLMQENGELRETVRMLSERLRGSENRVSPEEVRKLARRFKEDTGTRVPLKTITENMQTAFDAMANARGSGDSQAAMEMMGSIAQDMLEKSAQANREMYDQYEEMRGYFHGGIGLSETQWQEVKKQYGGNAAFRRAIAGLGLKVLPEGSRASLDANWGEMCAQWPEFFQPDTNEGDQVEAVVAALNAVQVTYENPYGSSLPEYASDMAMLMYEEYLGMPEVKDGQARQVEKLTRQLSEARATIREQAAQVRKVGRLEARIQEYKEAAQGRYRRQAQRRKDNQDYAKMRGQVIRQRDQLLKKLREPRLGAFIPQSMNDAVTELMRAIDFEGRLEGYKDGKQRNVLTAEAINRAKEAYKALGQPDADGARGPFAAYVNGDLVSDFDLLAESANGKAARDLTMREMEALRNIVAGYTAAVVNEDRLFMQERKESLSEAGEEMAAGMLTRREKMKQGNFAKWGANAVSKGLLKPVTVFGQFRDTPMEAAWKALRNAENVHIRNVSGAQEFLEAALKQYGQQESIRTEGSQAKRSRAKTYTTADGRKLQLTDQELMTLYATWKREQLVGTNHLLGGGFTLANAPKGTSTAPIRLAGPDLQEMIDRGLTKQQKDYVDHMVEYLSGQCADWGNEVTMQLYGVEKFHEDYYIPFSVNKNYVAQEPATEQDSRLKTGSFTKALTDKASAPLEIRPFTEIWCQHVEKMSDYNAFVLPIEDMTRLMNYKTEGGERIRALVKRYYSPQTAEYIMNFLSRLNGNSATEAGGSWLNAFMSKAKGAAVTFNLSVAIQQAGSAARAMAEIDPKYFYGGTALAAANLGRRAAGKLTGKGSISSSYAELEKYAPIAILKGWGYFDTNMSRGMYQRARSDAMGSVSDWRSRDAKENPGMTFTLAREKLYDKASDWGGKLAELGDRATWARIWEAVKLEVADTHSDLTKGSEEYFEACAERFTEVIDRTQVVDSVFQRAEWATEKGMMKQQMAFMSEPLTMYNMVYRAVEDLAGANGKAAKAKAGKQLARTLGSITVSSAVTAALKSIVTALRDRDNEKKDEEGNIIGVRTGADKWLDAMGGNFAENMLGIGTILTGTVQAAFSFTGSSDLTTQWMSDLAGAMKEMQKGVEGDWWKAAYKMTRGSSSLLGIGFGNLWRDVESIYRSADEYFARDSLAGAAWDKSLSFEKRVAAAEKNYVMKKQGDGRKENSDIYYDLMMDAYYTGGFGEDFATVVDAAIRTGGGEGIANSFKTKLREAEERVRMAAQALMDGDMTEYSRMYEELCESAVGRRVVASMINSEYSALQEKEEKEPPTSGSIIAELQRDDVATDPREMAANQAYSAAVEAGSATQLKQAVSALKAAGVDEETLYGKVRTTYKKDYCWAIWSGDRTTAQKASEMMKGAGVGIDNATLKAWTSDLNGSYASDEMYRLMREGDGKQAHLIHKYLVQANSSADMDKKLKDWVRKYVKGGKDEANVRAALKQMGYSQATIDSWFK